MAVWGFSVGLALPLGLGLGGGPSVAATESCGISNANYILFGSVFAYFLPCLAMLIVNVVVCHRLHSRLRAVRLQEMAAEQLVTFGAHLNRVVTTAHGETADLRANLAHWAMPFLQTLEEHRGAAEDTDADDISANDIRELTSLLHNLERVADTPTLHNLTEETIPEETSEEKLAESQSHRETPGSPESLLDPLGPPMNAQHRRRSSSAARRLSQIQVRLAIPLKKKNSVQTAADRLKAMKGRAVRLLMRIRHKEGQAVRKESRATKLVATVLSELMGSAQFMFRRDPFSYSSIFLLVVFLVCWTPFFALNMLKVFGGPWNGRLEFLFNLSTWLGYINVSIIVIFINITSNPVDWKFPL